MNAIKQNLINIIQQKMKLYKKDFSKSYEQKEFIMGQVLGITIAINEMQKHKFEPINIPKEPTFSKAEYSYQTEYFNPNEMPTKEELEEWKESHCYKRCEQCQQLKPQKYLKLVVTKDIKTRICNNCLMNEFNHEGEKTK